MMVMVIMLRGSFSLAGTRALVKIKRILDRSKYHCIFSQYPAGLCYTAEDMAMKMACNYQYLQLTWPANQFHLQSETHLPCFLSIHFILSLCIPCWLTVFYLTLYWNFSNSAISGHLWQFLCFRLQLCRPFSSPYCVLDGVQFVVCFNKPPSLFHKLRHCHGQGASVNLRVMLTLGDTWANLRRQVGHQSIFAELGINLNPWI